LLKFFAIFVLEPEKKSIFCIGAGGKAHFFVFTPEEKLIFCISTGEKAHILLILINFIIITNK